VSGFTFNEVYTEGNKKVLEIDILPGNYCNFNCVFCPVVASNIKGATPQLFDETKASLMELSNILKANTVDLVYLNSSGESFLNNKLEEVIDLVKNHGIKVRLFSNGYFLGEPEHMKVANMCDEVIGEIKCATETSFQKYQRPLTGYTLDKYISNMAVFKKQYPGEFTLIVTVLKGCNDDNESISRIKEAFNQISPHKILIETMTDDKFGKVFGVSEDKVSDISRILLDEK